MSEFQIIQGDALTVLRSMASESVQMCVTSPPYWGLRDYGSSGQLGLEASPQNYIAVMAEIFEELRRVLRPDGTLWLNIGDSYNAGTRGNSGAMRPGYKQATNIGSLATRRGTSLSPARTGGANSLCKPKDLMGMPWRVAFALQDAGWWLRQDIIWSKPNPMPEPARDRCAKSHEYIFLLTKSARYYFDADAIKEPVTGNAHARGDGVNPKARSWKTPDGWDTSTGNGNHGSFHKNGREKGLIRPRQNESFSAAVSGLVDQRNKRSVWTVPTQPMADAHFATFPEKLIEPCILAGSREGDLVLDPFSGSGTTGLVSLKNRRQYVGIELNPDYIAISEKRLREVQVKLF